jgi:nucleotide-binding universal stress UspA family protein
MVEKKILLAVDESVHSKQAVQYAARMSSAAQDMAYTLFNVEALVPRIFTTAAATDSEVRDRVAQLVRKNADAARSAVQGCRDVMVREGIPASRVETVTEPMQMGMAKDILNRAEKGAYAAIVLARRALTPSRDFFIGTTAAKVVEHAIDIPVWIVAGEKTSMKIMVAVDGSENSLRDIEHLIHLVGARPDLQLTLFHVLSHLRHYYSVDFEVENPKLQEVLEREDKRRMEAFYEEARQRLRTAGIKKTQIRLKTAARSHDISTAILAEAKTGQYGTVVIGRRGERDAFFTGRIAMRLVQKVTDQTLWVVP